MDLFSIAATLWRHKKVSLTVALLTLVGVVYVVAVQAASYQSDAQVLLTGPTTSASASEIAKNPALAKTNNPLANLGSLTYVAEALVNEINDRSNQQILAQSGVSKYQVSLANPDVTNVPPSIDIVATSTNPQMAIQGTREVASDLVSNLETMQSGQGVQSKYMIKAIEYVAPTSASKASSGQARVAVGVLAVGLICLLVAVSLAEGREQSRRKAHQNPRQNSLGSDGYQRGDRSQESNRDNYPVSARVAQPMEKEVNPYAGGSAHMQGMHSAGGPRAWR